MGTNASDPKFMIVPMEPTAAMLEASWTATIRGAQEDPLQFIKLTGRQKHWRKMERRWAAMLNAAPGPFAPSLIEAICERDDLRAENARLRAALSKASPSEGGEA